MEALARFARGRAAEVLGEDAAGLDVVARRLGLHVAAADAARRLRPEDLRILEPYAEGVLDGDAHAPPVPERVALGIAVADWRSGIEDVLVDVCAVGLLHALGLSDAWRRRIARAWLAAEDVEEIARLRAAFGALAPASDAAPAAGSNAFAVAGSRTASGAPVLGGDPHLGAQAPGPFMEMHLRCDDLHVTGATLPGLPNVLAGRNERVGWATTSSQADVADCYRERIEGDVYLTPAGWVPLRRRTEVVAVRGGVERVIEVSETAHGPLIADDVAWRWVHRDVPLRPRALEAVNEATGWDGFRAGLREYSGVGLSVVYADVDGVIARQQAGPVPRRASGAPEPRLLCGWTGADEWDGLLDFEELAGERDPESGIVCAANDDPGAGSARSGADWDWDGRAQRMRTLLEAAGTVTLDVGRRVQLDLASPLAARFRPLLLEAEPAVRSWDLRMTADSEAAALFERWYRALARELVGTGDELARALDDVRAWWSCWGVALLEERLAALDAGERRRCSLAALAVARAGLQDALGDPPWVYGRLTQCAYAHPLGEALSVGPFALPGGVDTLWRGDPTGNGRGVPMLRQLCDLADPDGGLAALPTGNSGIPGDSHYADQAEAFLAGEYRPWRMRSDEEGAEEELQPSRRATSSSSSSSTASSRSSSTSAT